MKRIAKVLLPLVAVLAILFGGILPAGANENYIVQPFGGNCQYHVIWNQGSYGTMMQIQAVNPYFPSNQCSSYYQLVWLCGLYGVPPTYYYEGIAPHGVIVAGAYESRWYGTEFGAACGTYGGDVIINWWIIVSAGPYANICWNQNGGVWAGGSNGPGGVCQFV